MARVSAATGEFLRTVASEYLVLLEVRAAGATGMGAGVEALPEAFFAKASAVPGVTRVEKYLLTRTVDAKRTPASVSMIVGVEPGDTLRVAEHGELRRLRVLAGRVFSPEDRGEAFSPWSERRMLSTMAFRWGPPLSSGPTLSRWRIESPQTSRW